MKYTYLFLLLLTLSCVSEKQPEIKPSIIPEPNKMEVVNGSLKLSGETTLLVNKETLISLAEKFKSDVTDRISVKVDNSEKAQIKLERNFLRIANAKRAHLVF